MLPLNKTIIRTCSLQSDQTFFLSCPDHPAAAKSNRSDILRIHILAYRIRKYPMSSKLPHIRTQRLNLRPIQTEDAKALFQYRSQRAHHPYQA